MVELLGLIPETVWKWNLYIDALGMGLPLSRLRVILLRALSSKRVYDINGAFQTSTVCLVFGFRSGVSRLSDYCLGLSDSFLGCLKQAIPLKSALPSVGFICTMIGRSV